MATERVSARHSAEHVLRTYIEAMLRQRYTVPEVIEALMSVKIELVSVDNWQKIAAEADFKP
jgi:hypothetical protein